MTRPFAPTTPLLPALLGLLLAACSAPQPPPSGKTTRPEPPARDLVAEVRDLAARSESALDVQPLRDPAVEDLRTEALAHDSAGRFEEAALAIAAAIAITPHDPELLQLQAEIALRQRDWDNAERGAYASFQLGPKLGALCLRNWHTVRLAREMRGQAEAAGIARDAADRCRVEPPVRM